VSLWRVVAWDAQAAPGQPGHPLWLPREHQGDSRHDNPDQYGCLYVSEQAVSAVAEHLQAFRGAGRLIPSMLTAGGAPLALAEISAPSDWEIVDLDDPRQLLSDGLRPSELATGRRRVTQAIAASLYERHDEAAGLRWWSTLEGSWLNLTVFDRASGALSIEGVDELRLDHQAVTEAAEFLGLMP
jgi:RES domain-containing protein